MTENLRLTVDLLLLALDFWNSRMETTKEQKVQVGKFTGAETKTFHWNSVFFCFFLRNHSLFDKLNYCGLTLIWLIWESAEN